MSFRAAIVTVLAPALLALPTACGGDDTPSDAAAETTTAATTESTATVPTAALAGTWTDGQLVVRFDDGTFTLDGDGSLEDGEFVNGTYTVEGSRVRFVGDELGPRGCGGQEWEWEVELDGNTLSAELLQEVCQTSAGTRWSLVKQPDS